MNKGVTVKMSKKEMDRIPIMEKLKNKYPTDLRPGFFPYLTRVQALLVLNLLCLDVPHILQSYTHPTPPSTQNTLQTKFLPYPNIFFEEI